MIAEMKTEKGNNGGAYQKHSKPFKNGHSKQILAVNTTSLTGNQRQA